MRMSLLKKQTVGTQNRNRLLVRSSDVPVVGGYSSLVASCGLFLCHMPASKIWTPARPSSLGGFADLN